MARNNNCVTKSNVAGYRGLGDVGWQSTSWRVLLGVAVFFQGTAGQVQLPIQYSVRIAVYNSEDGDSSLRYTTCLSLGHTSLW